MKKLKQAAILFSAFFAFAFFACKSTPEEQPAPVEETVETEETPVEEKDYSESNKSLLESVETSRQSAIDSGADKNLQNAFSLAEAEYLSVKTASLDSKQDLSKVLSDLNLRYEALEEFSKAKSSKDRIDSLNFASYDQASYDEGKALLEEFSNADAQSLLNFGGNWKSNAKKSNEDFLKVLDTGFRTLGKAERTSAFTAKKSADEVKASVSRKADYDKAVADFTAGDSNYVTKNPEAALESYTKSKEAFEKLYNEIYEVRAKALAAVEEAKKRVALSETTAESADETAPLGDKEVEGIESEETQLLAEDDFTQAANSVVELEESLEGESSEKTENSESENTVVTEETAAESAEVENSSEVEVPAEETPAAEVETPAEVEETSDVEEVLQVSADEASSQDEENSQNSNLEAAE